MAQQAHERAGRPPVGPTARPTGRPRISSTIPSTVGPTVRQTVRATRQGGVVRDALAQADAFRSAQAVFGDLRERGERIGLSTVYRHLQALADSGRADTLQSADGEVVYRLCGDTAGHHHHLVCRVCGNTVEIEGRSIERWAEKMAADNGFTDVAHTVELLGVCAGCSR